MTKIKSYDQEFQKDRIEKNKRKIRNEIIPANKQKTLKVFGTQGHIKKVFSKGVIKAKS